MALPRVISQIKRYIGRHIFHTLPAFDAPVRGPRRSIAIMIGTEKLELCGYPKVNKSDDTR